MKRSKIGGVSPNKNNAHFSGDSTGSGRTNFRYNLRKALKKPEKYTETSPIKKSK